MKGRSGARLRETDRQRQSDRRGTQTDRQTWGKGKELLNEGLRDTEAEIGEEERERELLSEGLD